MNVEIVLHERSEGSVGSANNGFNNQVLNNLQV